MLWLAKSLPHRFIVRPTLIRQAVSIASAITTLFYLIAFIFIVVTFSADVVDCSEDERTMVGQFDLHHSSAAS